MIKTGVKQLTMEANSFFIIAGSKLRLSALDNSRPRASGPKFAPMQTVKTPRRKTADEPNIVHRNCFEASADWKLKLSLKYISLIL